MREVKVWQKLGNKYGQDHEEGQGMKVRQLAICDSDSGYLRMLQAYLQRRNPADFEILIFDAVHKALEASHRTPFEILLVGPLNRIGKFHVHPP